MSDTMDGRLLKVRRILSNPMFICANCLKTEANIELASWPSNSDVQPTHVHTPSGEFKQLITSVTVQSGSVWELSDDEEYTGTTNHETEVASSDSHFEQELLAVIDEHGQQLGEDMRILIAHNQQRSKEAKEQMSKGKETLDLIARNQQRSKCNRSKDKGAANNKQLSQCQQDDNNCDLPERTNIREWVIGLTPQEPMEAPPEHTLRPWRRKLQW